MTVAAWKEDGASGIFQRSEMPGEAAPRSSSPITTDRTCWCEHTTGIFEIAGIMAQRNERGQKSPAGRPQGYTLYPKRGVASKARGLSLAA